MPDVGKVEPRPADAAVSAWNTAEEAMGRPRDHEAALQLRAIRERQSG